MLRSKTIEELKNQPMKNFSMKDLGEAKTNIGWEITWDILARTVKIDQKRYIRDIFESKEMTLCHLTVFLVKTYFILFIDQLSELQKANIIAY